MSQTDTSLLDEVAQWSQETCRQELKAVLPKLSLKSANWDDHIRVLKIITDMFLPHIGLSEVEDKCFSKILPQAVTVFESMVKEILDQVGELSSQNTELCARIRRILQAMMQIIDALSTCVRHISSFEKAPHLEAVRSLPTCVLRILKGTFYHCKDSEVVYCGRLSLVADLLQGLFKEAYSLQKGLLELLDGVSLDSSASEEEVSDIVTVIHNLLDICSIISNLDVALHANTWKFLIRQSLKYRSLVEEHLHHGDINTNLCENLLTSFHNSVDLAEQIKHAGLQEATQSTEYKLFQKSAKTCRFFANTLIHYIKEFKCFLMKHCSDYHQLYLQILSKFPPSLYSPTLPKALSEELNVAALVPMDALLHQLLPLRSFSDVVLGQDLRLSPEHELPHCLLLSNVLDQLVSQPEEVQQLWYNGSQFSEETPRFPLYKALFSSFRRSSTERRAPVLLPGVMMRGQAQALITLHHHICVHLCASVAALPSVYFPTLERCFFDAVMQADTQTALLATDVWCFTARYGSAELCLHHVLLIGQLLKTCTVECYQSFHLGLLLKRMVFLMTPNHQMELLTHFPPSEEENLAVWRRVLLRALSQDVRQRVETDIIGLAQKVLSDWQNGGYKLGHMHIVNVALLSLLAVVKGQKCPEELCVLSVTRMVTQLWLRLSPEQVQTRPVLQVTLQTLLSISATVVKNIEPQVICQALLCVDAVVSQKCSDQVLLAALEFLSSLGKIFIPPDSQSQILPRVSSLFSLLLAHTSWLIHQHALVAFSQLAEVTNHEEVISQSLCVEETKTKVVNYLSKTVNAQEKAESQLERLKTETSVVEKHNESLESNNGHVRGKRFESTVVESEPSPKRARQETSVEEYSRHIQTAESAFKALQDLIEKQAYATAPPLWLDTKLQELQTLITHIRAVQSSTD